MFSEEIQAKKENYRLHEVQFYKVKDSRNQFDQLLESKYYSDNDEQRMKFMQNKQGFHKCYVMSLHDKEMYQQKKVNELIQIGIKYMDNMKPKFDQMDEKQQKELIFFLRNLDELMQYMNIFDFNLWRVYFETIVLVSKTQAYTYNFVVLLSSIDQFCKQFYQENCDVFKKKIVFKDSELPAIITPKLVNQLLSNMEKCPIKDPNPQSFVLSMYQVASIFWKLSKTTSILLSGYHRMQFYSKYQQHAINLLKTIDLNLATSLYYSFCISGAINNELLSAFNNCFLSKINELKKSNLQQQKIINMWSYSGTQCQEIYDQIETERINHLFKNGNIKEIIQHLSLVPQTNLKINPEVIKKLLNHISNNTEYTKSITQLQVEQLFNILVHLKYFMPEVISNEFLDSQMFNMLFDYMKTNHFREINQDLNQYEILDIKSYFTQMKESISKQTTGLQYKLKEKQDFSKSNSFKQEHISLQSLLYWVQLQNLQDEFIILSNYKIYIYEIDILIYSKKFNKFIDIEVCGNNYVNQDGSLLGKKLLKDKILKAHGIDIKYFQVNDENIYNHTQLNATRKISRKYIGEKIFKLIEESLNYEYPKVDLNNKKFILPQDIDEQDSQLDTQQDTQQNKQQNNQQ